ncbi:hypothetical protein PROFUN_08608 [Planoprotostelium fungivorum]|uniref:SH2 domain-containing protein n=1 Tax=Planoprotostelium fungivorum TaxID=1890364 RepID=A0A2P6NJ91_9EUKA|nr:hypothetical protein PROFUN_08608 [Planoprotostelium fungivorum]
MRTLKETEIGEERSKKWDVQRTVRDVVASRWYGKTTFRYGPIQSILNSCNASIQILSRLKSSSGGCKMFDEYIDVLKYACEIDGRRVNDDKEDGTIIRFISNPRLCAVYGAILSDIFKHSYGLLEFQPKGVVAQVFGQDVEGRKFWKKQFRGKFMVPFDIFRRQWGHFTKNELDDDEVRQMQYILDYSQTKSVSVHRFAAMLTTFGPLSQCLSNMNELLSKRWFYGYMTQREAEELLSDEPSSFLVRFDLSRCDCVVISSNVTGSVKHYAVSFVSGQRRVAVWSEEEGRVVERESIGQFVTESNLGRPYISDIPIMRYFCGDVQSSEAALLLAGKPEGTYLVRFSSSPGFFTVSFVDKIHTSAQHRLIRKNTQPFELEEEIRIQADRAQIPLTLSSLDTSRRAVPSILTHSSTADASASSLVYAKSNSSTPRVGLNSLVLPRQPLSESSETSSIYMSTAAICKSQRSPPPRETQMQLEQAGSTFIRARPTCMMARTRVPAASPSQQIKELNDTLASTVQHYERVLSEMAVMQAEESARHRETRITLQDTTEKNRMLAEKVAHLEHQLRANRCSHQSVLPS